MLYQLAFDGNLLPNPADGCEEVDIKMTFLVHSCLFLDVFQSCVPLNCQARGERKRKGESPVRVYLENQNLRSPTSHWKLVLVRKWKREQ